MQTMPTPRNDDNEALALPADKNLDQGFGFPKALLVLAGVVMSARSPRVLEEPRRVVALPPEQSAHTAQLRLLIAAGGDGRLALDPATRRNRYGVPAEPEPDALWFSSSTACAVSPRGWAAAGVCLGRTIGGAVSVTAWFDDIRDRLARLYGLPGTEVVLAPSGTEAELVALQLALALAQGPVVSILLAPGETGAGAAAAAAGRHFLADSSLGGPVAQGERLVGWEDAAITLETVEIRDAGGRLRWADEVDAEAAAKVEAAAAAGAFVVLHVLDASKTGQGGVSRAAAASLAARYPGRVLALVDACQLRSDPEVIREDLAAGFAVMISGSKFAGGPPFSGAVMLPGPLATRLAAGAAVGPALAPYSAALDWPRALRARFAGGLAHPANLGLALRWTAALAEIEAFEAIPQQTRERLIAAFDAAVRARVAADRELETLDETPGAAGLVAIVQRSGADPRMVYEALKAPPAGARPCHLGQPVAIGARTALRVAASMPMIIAAASDGFAALEADLDALFDSWAAARRQASRSPSVARSPTALDPVDWRAFRADAHGALDAAIDRLERAGDGPVWRAMPTGVRASFEADLPRSGRPFADVLADFEALIAPYGVGNTHPRFFGWAHGAGTPVGMAAEMIAAGLDLNCGGRDHIGPVVERQVARWAAEAFGFPSKSSGVFVTGASQANFLGMLVARDAALGHGVRASGLRAAPTQLTAYASAEAHACVAQAAELAGVGGDFLRRIETDAAGAMRLDALVEAIVADRASGLRPFVVVGTAGGVSFGAFDDLEALADLCVSRRLWLHVDGAFGALTALSERLKPLVRGLERADSIAFDFHKWAHAPYDAGFFLARDPARHRGTFAQPAAYLARAERGLAAGAHWANDYGPDLSRGFRALKVWMTFETLGADAIGAAIEANCEAARRLAARITGSAVFELAAPVPLNIVCFSLKGEAESMNGELVMRLQERGLAAPSTTRIGGRLVVRAAIFNHRTTAADVDAFAEAAEAVAAELVRVG
jgi:glutamate/tyrosine decarboxylase-like PLP-dependent enzyme